MKTSSPTVTVESARTSSESASLAGDASTVRVTRTAPSPSAAVARRRKWQFVNLTTQSWASRDLSTTNGREFWRSVRTLRPTLVGYGSEGGKMVAHYRDGMADFACDSSFVGRLVAL